MKSILRLSCVLTVLMFCSRPVSAQTNSAWENSLGMKFMPVMGTNVLFGIWDVRLKDYSAYASAKSGKGGSWENPVFRGIPVTPSEDSPVVMVSWNDAKAFCVWLTEKERKEGKIRRNQIYRLPRDREWQQAAGYLKTPADGDNWQAPKTAGNYADETTKKSFADLPVIEGYTDGFATTSPVGSFKPNKYGLYDMDGNVVQWCEDAHENKVDRVLRGSSWHEGDPEKVRLSARSHHLPTSRANDIGFRIVLAENIVETAPSSPRN